MLGKRPAVHPPEDCRGSFSECCTSVQLLWCVSFCGLVVVGDFCVMGVRSVPAEADAPLPVRFCLFATFKRVRYLEGVMPVCCLKRFEK